MWFPRDTEVTILQRVSNVDAKIFYESYNKGDYPEERLGQAFLNRFYPYVTDSELFYETDPTKAAAHIEEHYVVLEIAA